MNARQVCANTTVKWAISGHGTWGYLMHKQQAAVLLDLSNDGFDRLIDQFLFLNTHVCWLRPGHEILQKHNYTASIRTNMNHDVVKAPPPSTWSRLLAWLGLA